MEATMYYPFLYKSYFEGDETHLSLSVKSVNPKSASLNLDGYKHSMVQIIALALAAKTAVIIENPPLVIDTYVFVALIKEMGGDAKIIHNKLHIDMKNVCINTISYYLSQLIHGSMYLCPALLCSNGEFNYYGSGGCRIGNGSNNERPVEHIMSVMKSFGASIEVNPVGVHGTCNIDNSREPVEINISNYSTAPGFLSGALVGGATKTAIIMSLSREKVIIKDPYLKTDVLDMIAFIQLLGKKVVVNQNELIISGEIHKNCKQAYRVTLTECVSEIITYSTLALLQQTKLTFKELNKPVIVKGLKPEFELFDNMGIVYKWEKNDLIIEPTLNISPQIIDVWPQTIQSDHQPFFALLLTFGKGVSVITDHVWNNRYHYINNLNMMNCDITQKNNAIQISPSTLMSCSSDLPARDVRCAAVTLLAMILSRSSSNLIEAEHIFRGYSNLQEHLLEMGVSIIC